MGITVESVSNQFGDQFDELDLKPYQEVFVRTKDVKSFPLQYSI